MFLKGNNTDMLCQEQDLADVTEGHATERKATEAGFSRASIFGGDESPFILPVT